MTRTVLGHSVQRTEDPALLTGAARFMADLPIADGLHAVFVRSHVAHGILRSVDVSAAREVPGVDSVWTAADLALPDQRAFTGDEALGRPLLARDRVRFAGEPVAVVCAGSPEAAADAAELVVVEVEPLDAVTDPARAASGDAPVLFDGFRTNIVGEAPPATGAGSDGDGFFGDADVVVRTRITHQRVAPVTMEANGCVAVPSDDGSITVWASTQSVFGVQGEVARVLGVDPSSVRVRAPWIGGGFGAKGGVYPEQLVIAGLAHRLARTVRWLETRSENLLAMTHGAGRCTTSSSARRATGASPHCAWAGTPMSARTRPVGCSFRWSRA